MIGISLERMDELFGGYSPETDKVADEAKEPVTELHETQRKSGDGLRMVVLLKHN